MKKFEVSVGEAIGVGSWTCNFYKKKCLKKFRDKKNILVGNFLFSLGNVLKRKENRFLKNIP